MKSVMIIIVSISFLSNISFATTFYIDPMHGSNLGDGSLVSPWKTFKQVVNSNLIKSRSYVTPYNPNNPKIIDKNINAPIKAGDTLMLYSGLHGAIFLRNYINSKFITIRAVDGERPILKKIHIQGGEKWRFEGLTISSEPYGNYINDNLIFLEAHGWHGPVSQIEITDCNIFSTATTWTTANDWVEQASNGIVIKGDSVTVKNNSLSNIRFGIVMVGDYIKVIDNEIKNFSGDGIRILGSNNLVEHNSIKNCYAVDANHDDGIQSFTTGGLVVDNNIVRRNTIINYEDINQPLLGDLQGIGCFDGPYNNWTVENNLIIVNHWHGISFYGAYNCRIINNTILDPTPDIAPGPAWIKIEDDNNIPSSNCVVKNNVSNSLSINPNSNTAIGHNVRLTNYTDYDFNFVDYMNFNFHLKENSVFIDNADMSVSPKIDLDGVARPQGIKSDIGCYEYNTSLANDSDNDTNDISVFPNPSTNMIIVNGVINTVTIVLFDANGRLISQYSDIILPFLLKLDRFANGVYFLRIMNPTGREIYSKKIIKN